MQLHLRVLTCSPFFLHIVLSDIIDSVNIR